MTSTPIPRPISVTFATFGFPLIAVTAALQTQFYGTSLAFDVHSTAVNPVLLDLLYPAWGWRGSSPQADSPALRPAGVHSGTRVERHVRPLVIAALERRLPAHAALRTHARLIAGFRPPYTSNAAQSLVAIAFLIAAISAAASCWDIITDSGGVEALLSSTRPAAARRTGSPPTTTTSTARPRLRGTDPLTRACELIEEAGVTLPA